MLANSGQITRALAQRSRPPSRRSILPRRRNRCIHSTYNQRKWPVEHDVRPPSLSPPWAAAHDILPEQPSIGSPRQCRKEAWHPDAYHTRMTGPRCLWVEAYVHVKQPYFSVLTSRKAGARLLRQHVRSSPRPLRRSRRPHSHPRVPHQHKSRTMRVSHTVGSIQSYNNSRSCYSYNRQAHMAREPSQAVEAIVRNVPSTSSSGRALKQSTAPRPREPVH